MHTTKSIFLILSITIMAIGCTGANPRFCGTGACTDPNFPFCDINGQIAGTPQTCIAVQCSPGQFKACHDDTALICDSQGTNYTTVQCERGCDNLTGCRVCEPNQTTCANGTAQICNASGQVTSSETCVLGCLADQPQCQEIVPSNGLADYMAMAAHGPDLVLSDNVLLIPSGQLTNLTGSIGVTATLASSTISFPSGNAIQVFPVKSLTTNSVVAIQREDQFMKAAPAVAFVVYGDVQINGVIRLEPNIRGFGSPPGAVTTGDCVGQSGQANVGTSFYFSGSGGGGGATPGGTGGGNVVPGGAGGLAAPNSTLQPLRGGCSGGTPMGFPPGYGGGAIQITSRSTIHLAANARIEANGSVGYSTGPQPGQFPDLNSIPGGGGAGGGILLEAPSVTLDSGAALTANGGAGASGDLHAGTPASGSTPSLGGVCTAVGSPGCPACAVCTNGGNGGSISGPPGNAASLVFDGEQELTTGGGGGAMGSIRINTASGTYLQANNVYLSPIPSTSTITIR